MGLFSFLGIGSSDAKIKEAVAAGAVIIDVRTPAEYKSGHIKNSQNIPLSDIAKKAGSLKGKTVITCCRSGARSASAADILKQNGINAINGGGWTSLQNTLNS
jgi:phage shock protein E